MGIEVELIDPNAPRRDVDETDRDSTVERNWLAIVVVAFVGAVFVWFFVRDPGPPDTPVAIPGATPAGEATADALDGGAEVIDATEFPGVDPDAKPNRPGILRLWTAEDILVVIETPSRIYELNLETGLRNLWEAPEPLIDSDPLAIPGWFVVVGETSAWATPIEDPGSDWRQLGTADRVLPSTNDDRVWLRRPYVKENPTDAEFVWSETTLDGEVGRTLFRYQEVPFSTPEIDAGQENGLFRLTDNERSPWRTLSENGIMVASGLNDLIAWECGETLECKRVWYDPRSGDPKAGFYPELAYNVTGRLGGQLSPDGRYVISELDDDRLVMLSIASSRIIPNVCSWSGPEAWTTDGELFACQTVDGVEIYETFRGESLGLATNPFFTFARFAFIPPQ